MENKEYFEMQSGGETLRGFVLRSEGENTLGTVIISHGFGGNSQLSELYGRELTGLGYNAVCFDFCSSGPMCKSSGDSHNMSILTQKQDLLRLIGYVKAQSFAKEGELILFGFSQGGLVSALCAAELGEKVGRLVLVYPALVIPDHIRSGRAADAYFDPEDIPETIPTAMMELGRRYAEDVKDMDVFAIIGAYKGPVLIVHGMEDGLVPVDYSRRAAKVYGDVRLTEIHGDHGFFGAGQDLSIKIIKDFLR
ncbi:MAG: alpha/beta hydrolase [Ruminococcus sp.]|nr:alpha/beta hydrolase [Ruminococcus sp.]